MVIFSGERIIFLSLENLFKLFQVVNALALVRVPPLALAEKAFLKSATLQDMEPPKISPALKAAGVAQTVRERATSPGAMSWAFKGGLWHKADAPSLSVPGGEVTN